MIALSVSLSLSLFIYIYLLTYVTGRKPDTINSIAGDKVKLKTRHRRQLTSKIKQAVNIDKKLEQTLQEKTHEDEMEVNSITDWD